MNRVIIYSILSRNKIIIIKKDSQELLTKEVATEPRKQTETDVVAGVRQRSLHCWSGSSTQVLYNAIKNKFMCIYIICL